MTTVRRPYVGSYWVAVDPDRPRILVGKAVRIDHGEVFGYVCWHVEPGCYSYGWRMVTEASILSAITMEQRVLCEGCLYHPDAIRGMAWYQDLLVDRMFERVTDALDVI